MHTLSTNSKSVLKFFLKIGDLKFQGMLGYRPECGVMAYIKSPARETKSSRAMISYGFPIF